jgi:hypothetical protein
LDAGVIGVGMMGRNHARVYSELKAVDSLYLYDLNQKAARGLASTFEATASPTVEDLLKSVDAVSVCVPTPFHFAVAARVIDAGVPLLIEKPVCATAAEGRRLIGTLPDGLVVGVGHIERFNPIVPEIKKIVRHPLYIEMKRHKRPLPRERLLGRRGPDDPRRGYHAKTFFFRTEPIALPAAATRTYAALSSPSGGPRSTLGKQEIFKEDPHDLHRGGGVHRRGRLHGPGDLHPQETGQYAVEDERYVQENIIEKVLVNKPGAAENSNSRCSSTARHGDESSGQSPAQALTNMEICETSRGVLGHRDGLCMSSRLESIVNAKGPIRRIGVVGMGYVGIPAAVLFSDAPEFESVLGFQRASASSGYKIDMLNRGESPLRARGAGA